MHCGTLQQGVLVRLRNMPVKDHRVAVRGRVLAQLVLPPAGAHHVQHGAVYLRHRVDGLLDALMRHEARQGDQVHPVVVRKRGHFLGHRIHAVFHDLDIAFAHPQGHKVAFRRLRDRHVPRTSVDARRHARLQEPPQPPDHRTRHRPLLLVAVVREQHHGCAGEQPCKERDAVLCVHHQVRAVAPDRQRRGQVYAELAAGTLVAHPVTPRPARRTGVLRGPVNHLVALRGEILPDALEVTLGTATLRVG